MRTWRATTGALGALALGAGLLVAAPASSQAAEPAVIQILGINDFHGRISANQTEAGAAVLAGAVDQLRTDHPNTVFAAAGDLIGASTFESFIAHDKPTIDALNAAGLDVSSVGNHEFDQGYSDLVNRVMAPYDATTNPYGGAEWQYLGANVRMKDTHDPAIDATWIKDFGDVEVGFIGAVTEHLDELVSPAGIADLEIEDIVTATNREAAALKTAGADIVVLLVHEGAPQATCDSATDPTNDFGTIVNGVDDDVDAIISGHTHLTYNCLVPVPGWAGRAVTERPVVSAGQYGYNLDQLLFSVDATGEVLGVESNTLPLVTTVPPVPPATNPTYVPNYSADPDVAQIVADAVADADELGKVPLGQIAGPFNRAKLADGATENRGGESTLGNLVAEVQKTQTEPSEFGGAQIAFMNPGGLRADMVGNDESGYPAVLTYKQAAVVQPFANTLVNMKLTGAQIKTVLEQQWQPEGASRPFLRLGISDGFTYTYDPAASEGQHITAMWLDGDPIVASTSYSVTVNSFLAAGGDNFAELANGGDRRDTGQVDLQGMVDYLGAATGAVAPDFTQRSVGVSFPTGAPASYAPGDTVAFDVSSLAFSTAPDLRDEQLKVSLGGTSLGTFAVDNTIGDAIFDEYGTASVSVVLPAGTAAGDAELTLTGVTTGTVARVPLRVASAGAASRTKLTASKHRQVYGTHSPAALTAKVVMANGKRAHGVVRFLFDGERLGKATVAKNGKARFVLPSRTPAGTGALVAKFVPKDPSTQARSVSAPVDFVVAKATSKVVADVTIKRPSRIARNHGASTKAVLSVRVSLNTGRTAHGVVVAMVDGRRIDRAKLHHGRAALKVPVAKGRTTIVVSYTPADRANHKTAAKTVVVRR
jgi:5'-nucleotidase